MKVIAEQVAKVAFVVPVTGRERSPGSASAVRQSALAKVQ
jgi:hypothetical protein